MYYYAKIHSAMLAAINLALNILNIWIYIHVLGKHITDFHYAYCIKLFDYIWSEVHKQHLHTHRHRLVVTYLHSSMLLTCMEQDQGKFHWNSSKSKHE